MADQFQQSSAALNLNVTSAPQVVVEPAGFWVRFTAAFLDGMILGFLQLPIKMILLIITGLSSRSGDTAGGLIMMGFNLLLYLGSTYLYYGYFYSKKGASPGKQVMGLRVLREDTGTHLSYGQAFGREFVGKAILGTITFLVGYLLAAFREDKKALHDLAFGTRVVKIKK